MHNTAFISIDNFFYIKKNINQEILNKCITFIAKQKNNKREIIESSYKKKIIYDIKLSEKIYNKEVDIIIKTKFNNDYKFINLEKSILFYEHKDLIGLSITKIKQFNLDKIKFFPATYMDDELVIQQLAVGNYFRPNNLSDFNAHLFKNIAKVISVFSNLNNRNIKIINYLKILKVTDIKDSMSSKIIKTFILKLQNYNEDILNMSLTHGDFKFEHLFTLDNKLEYLIDWENVDVRSIYFDLFNFFVPWFVHRSYSYTDIKEFILKFSQNYLSNHFDYIKDNYDLYFSIFVLERYARIECKKNFKFNKNKAYHRFELLFKNLISD